MSLEKVKDNNVSRAEGSVVSSATGAGLMEHEGKEESRQQTSLFQEIFAYLLCGGKQWVQEGVLRREEIPWL